MHILIQPQLDAPLTRGLAVNQRLLAGQQKFLGYLRRRLGSLDEAEDALQNFSFKVIRAAQSSGPEEKINAWMGQILRHTLIDHYRRRAVRQRAENAYAYELSITVTAPDDIEITGQCRCLHKALLRLRPDHAAILRRADLEEEPRATIATNLGLTPNAFNVRLHRARQALRQELEATCPACRDGSFLDCACS
ncbi:RNA polymerase sigma factor [Cypionkella psychrotolerans]|uniref:RNA polymerase sigma factor n=1 Tax=Cypionkella psychrotolerans TaxID=1678131 RepID=UPI0006B50B46|nr:sigma-70 family RNA polymerase sigma factor [Cypionkella psychrotolerans]